MAGAAEKAVIMVKLTPKEFDLTREAVAAERQRAYDGSQDTYGNDHAARAKLRERTTLLDQLIEKIN